MDDSIVVEQFKALGDPVRWAIVNELRSGSRCACELSEAPRCRRRSVASPQGAATGRPGHRHKRGRWVDYTLDSDAFDSPRGGCPVRSGRPMSAPVLEHGAVDSAVRRWLLLVAAAVVWLGLYRVNLPWWDWVVYDVAGLDETTRVGGAVHFFLYDTTKIAAADGRDLRGDRVAQLHVGRADPRPVRRAARGRRQRRRGRAGGGDPVLLVFRRSCIHRVRRRRCSARRHPEFPDRQPARQRGRHRAAARPVRLEDHPAVHRRRHHDRDRRRVRARQDEARTMGGAVRVRNTSARQRRSTRPTD